MATEPVKVWTKLLGTSSAEYAAALTTGLDGSIYVSGITTGSLDGQTYSGSTDAFLTLVSSNENTTAHSAVRSFNCCDRAFF